LIIKAFLLSNSWLLGVKITPKSIKIALLGKLSYPKLRLIIPLSFSVLSCSSHQEIPLIGETSKEVLVANHQIFQDNFNEYHISETDKTIIEQWPAGLHLDIFFGTWCHDSQREVPKVLRILQETNKVSYQLIALDMYKSDPKELGESNKVKYTPTFIVKLEGKEIGRIVERPEQSLVTDISAFISDYISGSQR